MFLFFKLLSESKLIYNLYFVNKNKINLGENNLIEEQCEILNINKEPSDYQTESVMIIGNNNIFEVSFCIKVITYRTLIILL